MTQGLCLCLGGGQSRLVWCTRWAKLLREGQPSGAPVMGGTGGDNTVAAMDSIGWWRERARLSCARHRE